jgi:hypothetical protein
LREKVRIRREIREDLIAIRRINEKAFGGIQEANLVDDLRRSGTDLVSLLSLFFCPMNPLGLFGEAIAESMLCGVQSMAACSVADRRCGCTHPLGPGAKEVFYLIIKVNGTDCFFGFPSDAFGKGRLKALTIIDSGNLEKEFNPGYHSIQDPHHGTVDLSWMGAPRSMLKTYSLRAPMLAGRH